MAMAPSASECPSSEHLHRSQGGGWHLEHMHGGPAVGQQRPEQPSQHGSQLGLAIDRRPSARQVRVTAGSAPTVPTPPSAGVAAHGGRGVVQRVRAIVHEAAAAAAQSMYKNIAAVVAAKAAVAAASPSTAEIAAGTRCCDMAC
jgi:hypothetical protein